MTPIPQIPDLSRVPRRAAGTDHPRLSALTDYARAIPDSDRLAATQDHLDDGCEPCRATISVLQRVINTAENDCAIAPPAGAIRSVKAFFDSQQPESGGFSSQMRLSAAFDSALAPAAVGTREHGYDRRQLLFESTDYTVELSVDYSQGDVDAKLRGQILASRGEPRSHTPVFLVGDGEVIGRAISEQQGNFEMCGRVDQTSEVWVFPDDESRIRLSLKSEA